MSLEINEIDTQNIEIQYLFVSDVVQNKTVSLQFLNSE